MNTLKKCIVVLNLLILFLLLSTEIFSQYDIWGTSQEYNFTLNTYNTNDQTFIYDISSDNYGLHFVGLNNSNNHLVYYLLDNNGQILEQFENSEYTYYGVEIISSKGNVVIAAITQSGIVIFKKSNGVSTGFTKVDVFNDSRYTFGTSN